MSQQSSDPNITSKIQGVASAMIEQQARICQANLTAMRVKIDAMNGDAHEIAAQLEKLREQVSSLTTSVIRQIADLTLAMNKQIAAVEEETRRLSQRWTIWPTLEKVFLFLFGTISLALSVYAMFFR